MMSFIVRNIRGIFSKDGGAGKNDSVESSQGQAVVHKRTHNSQNLLEQVYLDGVYWSEDDRNSYLYGTPANLLRLMREEAFYGLVHACDPLELTNAHRDVINASLGINELEPIYSGTSSTLYRGKFGITGFKRDYAVKILFPKRRSPYYDHIWLIQFAREIGIMKHLNKVKHPNIVRYIAHEWMCNENNELLYAVIKLEWLECSLAMVKCNRRLSLAEVRLLARQIGGALAFLHEEKIVHHDVKGQNVMVHFERVPNPPFFIFTYRT